MADSQQQFDKPAQYLTQQQIPGTVYENLDQDIIHITADRAHRYLTEWRAKIEAQDSWLAQLSLMASFLLALITADFHDKFGIPKEYWSSIYFVALLITIGWLARSLKRRIWDSAESADKIIDKFKKKQPQP